MDVKSSRGSLIILETKEELDQNKDIDYDTFHTFKEMDESLIDDANLAGNKIDIKEKGLSMDNERFVCDQCRYSASTKSNLKNHINIVHNEIKSYGCDHCSQKFSQRYNLEKHMESRHKNA